MTMYLPRDQDKYDLTNEYGFGYIISQHRHQTDRWFENISKHLLDVRQQNLDRSDTVLELVNLFTVHRP